MNTARDRRIALAVACILFTSVSGFAQLNPEWSSIDLSVARASRVVIGRIAETDDRQQSVVLAVEETLKGEPVSQLPLTIGNELWQQPDREKVPCGICAAGAHRLLVTIGPAQDHPSSITDLDGDSAFNVSGDLHILSNAGAILQAAREEVGRYPDVLDRKEYFSWEPTEALMATTRLHGYTIYVPVDDRQENLAHRVLDTERVSAGVTRIRENDRANAAAVLAFFRSPENIQLLKSLLADSQIEHDAMGQLDYPVRAAAYRVLQQWGVEAPQPIMRVKIQEPWDGKRPPD